MGTDSFVMVVRIPGMRPLAFRKINVSRIIHVSQSQKPKKRFSRPNFDFATPCVCKAGLLSNQHENGQAIARWIAN